MHSLFTKMWLTILFFNRNSFTMFTFLQYSLPYQPHFQIAWSSKLWRYLITIQAGVYCTKPSGYKTHCSGEMDQFWPHAPIFKYTKCFFNIIRSKMQPPWPAIEPARKSLTARTCLNKIYESLQLQTQIPRTISSVNDTEITSTHMLEVEFLIYPCYTDMLTCLYL